MRHQDDYGWEPPICDCGHYFHVHPCTESGAWQNPIEPEPLIQIDDHTFIHILRHCLCEEAH